MSKITKKAQKESISSFLKTSEWNKPLNVEHLLFILEKHPQYESKTNNLKYWFCKKNEYGQISLFIMKNNNEIESFSYLACLTKFTKKQELMSALRNEIYSQIKIVKDTIKNNFVCPMCNLTILKENCHIDHNIVPFKTISEDWCKLENIDINSYTEIDTKSITYTLNDRTLAESWKKYHSEKATLVALCSSCNLSKGCKTVSF